MLRILQLDFMSTFEFIYYFFHISFVILQCFLARGGRKEIAIKSQEDIASYLRIEQQ